MYDELIAALRGPYNSMTDFQIKKQAADAIEQLQGRAKVLEKVADKWCEAVPKWIPVTERLPKLGERVIVWYLWHDDVNFSASLDEMIISDRTMKPKWRKHHLQNHVTHWMPLPTPPKEEKIS